MDIQFKAAFLKNTFCLQMAYKYFGNQCIPASS